MKASLSLFLCASDISVLVRLDPREEGRERTRREEDDERGRGRGGGRGERRGRDERVRYVFIIPHVYNQHLHLSRFLQLLTKRHHIGEKVDNVYTPHVQSHGHCEDYYRSVDDRASQPHTQIVEKELLYVDI